MIVAPVIPATQEVEVGGSELKAGPRGRHETVSKK
jgi:hypothetical protein